MVSSLKNWAVKVSVIVPVYNTAEYLENSLKTILNQSLKDIEIICIDDGSTDASLSILEKIKAVDSRLIILTQNNEGAGSARNMGIAVATGEYLSFLDSDDIFEEDMLENMYNAAKVRDADITVCNYKRYDKDTNHLSKSCMLSAKKYQKYPTFNYTNCMHHDIFTALEIVAWNKLYRHEFIVQENLQYQTLKRTNDLYFVAVSLLRANKIIYLNDAYVKYKTTFEPVRKKSLTDQPYDCCIALNALYGEISTMNDMPLLLPSFLNLAYSLPRFYLNLVASTTDFDTYDAYYKYLKTEFYPRINKGCDKNECAYRTQWFWTILENYSSEEYLTKKYLEIGNIVKNSKVLVFMCIKVLVDSIRSNGYRHTLKLISRNIFGGY